MHQLILIDRGSKQELGRRDMAPQERYEYGRMCMEHEILSFGDKRYKAIYGVWQIPEHNFVMQVIFDSWEASYCDC